MNTFRIGILASTNGTDMQAIIDAIEDGSLENTEISIVVSNKVSSYALERARKYRIKTAFLNPKDFDSREKFDHAVAKVLDSNSVDLILMIGYMRIVSDWFVEHFKGKMLNVHPSLLPAFAGGMDTNVHEEVLKSGVKQTGCTIHEVSEELDGGKIIWQKAIEIREDETVESLKTRVQQLEGQGFLEVIQQYKSK